MGKLLRKDHISSETQKHNAAYGFTRRFSPPLWRRGLTLGILGTTASQHLKALKGLKGPAVSFLNLSPKKISHMVNHWLNEHQTNDLWILNSMFFLPFYVTLLYAALGSAWHFKEYVWMSTESYGENPFLSLISYLMVCQSQIAHSWEPNALISFWHIWWLHIDSLKFVIVGVFTS